MIFRKSMMHLLLMMFVLILLTGCRASGNHRAPIEERGAAEKRSANVTGRQDERDGRFKLYVIQKGDTLYSIAFDNGLDYKEVAEQNNIENPSAIQIGQKIKLYTSEEEAGERANSESQSQSISVSTTVIKKDYPKVIKLPYSELAVAQLEKMQDETSTTVAVVVPPVVQPKPIIEAEIASNDSLNWGLPTKGKVIAEYSESANRKGVDIVGSRGQSVVASEAGKVVYSGSGLRGYGKLVIIKHNKTFLSAYAHNENILVKEGQSVSKGQQIAEMGSSDADQVKLHFEIRKFGKPVDPSKYLNFVKS